MDENKRERADWILPLWDFYKYSDMGTRPSKERIELGTRNMHGLWKICIWFLDRISIVKNEIGSFDFGGFMGVCVCVCVCKSETPPPYTRVRIYAYWWVALNVT